MYFQSGSYFQAGESSWDPEKTISLFNPDKGRATCVGHAKTQGRRCRLLKSPHTAEHIFYTLSMLDPCSAAQSPRLWDAARSMLCHHHVHQVDTIVSKWQSAIRAQDINSQADRDLEDMMSSASALLAELRRRQREYDEARRFTERERQRKAAAMKEQQRRDEEKKRRQEEFERQERERERRKQADDRAKAAERRQQAEREEWEQAWKRYTEAWRAHEANQASPNASIPWPTKSGRWQDVSETNTREFFRKAPISTAGKGGDEERFSLMTKENKRWHTDKIQNRFGSAVLIGPREEQIDLVSKLVVQLRIEANNIRKRK